MDLINALRDLDLGTIVMTVGLCILWAITGFQLCKLRHKQRGIEVHERAPDFIPGGPKASA